MKETMRGFWGRTSGIALLLALTAAGTAAAQAPAAAAAPDGADLYKRSCASCHDAGVGRAPTRDQFRAMLPAAVPRPRETGGWVRWPTAPGALERRAFAECPTARTLPTG